MPSKPWADLEKKDWKMEASRQTNKKAIVEDNIPPLLELDLATVTRKKISKRRSCHRCVSGATYQLQLLSLDDSPMVLENGDRLRGVSQMPTQIGELFIKDNCTEESGLSDRISLTSDSKDPKSVKVRRIPVSYADFQFDVRNNLNASMPQCI